MKRQKALAWAVHAYTASGGVLGMLALIAITQDEIHRAIILLGVAMVIDGTDGMLARWADVKRVLPGFSGAEIDNVIDFLTFVWIPALFMFQQDMLLHPVLAGVPVIASLYAYGQVNMKSPDGFFIGFPSYWNAIAVYLYWLQPGALTGSVVVVIAGVLSFVPTRYLYPSRSTFLPRVTWVLFGIWGIMLTYLILTPAPLRWVVQVSLFYPAYYMAASFFAEFRFRRKRALTPPAG